MQRGTSSSWLLLPGPRGHCPFFTHLGCRQVIILGRQVIILGRQVSEGLLQGLFRLPMFPLETRQLILERLERGGMYRLGL